MGREGRNDAVEIARQEKNRWKKRALNAEATLAKVREWAETHSRMAGMTEGYPLAASDALAILDESPTERETPAEEVTAPEVLKAVDDFRRIQDADFEHYDAALAGYLMAEFKIARRGGSR